MGKPTNPKAFQLARERAGLTVTQVKDRFHISRNTVYRLEKRPARWPAAHVVDVLARAYGVPSTYFYEEPRQ